MRRRILMIFLIFSATFLDAQEDMNSSLEDKKITIFTAMLSNYMWRGATLDDNKAVVQAAYTIECLGAYAKMFMSSGASVSDLVPSAGYKYVQDIYSVDAGMYWVTLAPVTGYRFNIAGEAYVKFGLDLGIKIGIDLYQELLAEKKQFTAEITLYQDLKWLDYLVEAGHNTRTNIDYVQLTLNLPSTFTGGNWVFLYGVTNAQTFPQAWGVGHSFIF